jgi:hypothetical protein
MAEAARVRQTVKGLLASCPGYSQLPQEKKKQIARDMVLVAAYMADPHGLMSSEARQPVLSRRSTHRSVSSTASRRSAMSLRDGTDVLLGELGHVDFPAFVSGLINGVFHAIVDASILQMDAYAKMLAEVAKTVDAFMKDGLTDKQVRDDLTSRFPDLLCRGTGARAPLRWCGDAAAGTRVVQAALHLPDPPTDMRQLVTAARRRLAVQRQQMLATMVLMGINRIVVTDGKISARSFASFPGQPAPRGFKASPASHG